MKMLRGGKRLWCAAFGLGMALVAGCQTWPPEIGMTLPSPSYLKHPPQYIPPSPAFPLTRELASLEEAAAQQNARALPVIP
ncbi:MAG: hypothetical protein L0Y72_12020 [Gemmataceae bacterium]|nr:hypothetical protein [Gemmataceae bacterium]MCI0739763.1 hypothetical protein [Gemmataceae bacterium]